MNKASATKTSLQLILKNTSGGSGLGEDEAEDIGGWNPPVTMNCVAWHSRKSWAKQIPLWGGPFISSLNPLSNTESRSREVGRWGKSSLLSLFSLLFLTH